MKKLLILFLLIATACAPDVDLIEDITELQSRSIEQPATKLKKPAKCYIADLRNTYETTLSNYTLPTEAQEFNVLYTQPEFQRVQTERFSEYRHNYATQGIWNSDGTVLMLDRKMFYADGTYSGIDRGSLHWSKLYNNIQYSVWNNKIVKQELNYTTGTREETFPRDFTDYQELKLEGAHNETTLNDVIALHGRKFANDNVWIVRYNPNDDTYTEKEFDFIQHVNDYDKPYGLRWIKLSPDGRYDVLGFAYDGPGKNQGVWVYDNETTDYFQITEDRSHSDIGQMKDGTQIYVAYQNYNQWEYSMMVFNISTGEVMQYLLPNAMQPNWGHVSMRNYKEPGMVFVTLDGSTDSAYQGELAQIIIKIDLETGTYTNFGRTYNDANNYNEGTMGCPSPTGKQVGFASKWGDTSATNFFISSRKPCLTRIKL